MDNSGFDVQLADEQPTLGSLYHTECSICHLVLCNPCETTCCGVYFCRACIEKYHRQNRSCPHCRGRLDWHESKAQERLINQLKIVCKHRGKGCEWIGELAELSKHLNENSTGSPDTDCKFVLLECPRCHNHVDRGSFKLHTLKECPFKDVECPNCENGCTWKGQQRMVAKHLNLNPVEARRLEGCGFLKLDCIHECGKTIERQDLKEHEAQCQLELVECEFKALGCNAKVSRKDMHAHLLRSKQHVKQSCQACITLQEAMRESEYEIQTLRLSLNRTRWIASSALLVAVLLGLFNCFSSPTHGSLEGQPTKQSQLLTLPANLTFKNYSMHRDLGVAWLSPPVSLPEGKHILYVDFLPIAMSYYHTSLYIQFRLSGGHHLLKARIVMHLLSQQNFRQRIFQVEFEERGSLNEVVTGYHPFFDSDTSYSVSNNQLRFRVLQIETDSFVYPPNIFALCNWRASNVVQDGKILMPPTPYGSLLFQLSIIHFDKKNYVKIGVRSDKDYKIEKLTFSFYLLSGGTLDRNITIQEGKRDRGTIVLSHSEFKRRVVSSGCLAFEISSEERVPSSYDPKKYFFPLLLVFTYVMAHYIEFVFHNLDIHF